MIELTDIAYVRSGAADLAGAVDFATRIVGLELVDGGEPGVAHLRADARHHCLGYPRSRRYAAPEAGLHSPAGLVLPD